MAECNKTSCEKSYLFEFSAFLHYSFALERYTFLEIKEVNVSRRKWWKVGLQEETEENTATKPISAKGNKSSWEIIQCAYFPGAGFHEMFSSFPSKKAFNVERILLTFTR